MASYSSAEEEKRLLEHAEQTATMTTADAESQTKTRRRCSGKCKRRSSTLKRISLWALISVLIVAWCILAFGVTSVAVGAWRHAHSCNKPGPTMHARPGPVVVNGAPPVPNRNAAESANGADAGAVSDASPSAFSRLLEAVSPESLHDLLHLYFPNTYKHGVYPSEKSALEAIHRANAPLATSIVQLARRDSLNSTTTNSNPPPTSTNQGTSTPPPTSTNKGTTTNGQTTHTTSASQSSGKKITSTFTSTINGTPTVVTQTSTVGVGAANTGGGGTTPSGSLQTGAADALLAGGGNKARLAEAVAGVLVGALLI